MSFWTTEKLWEWMKYHSPTEALEAFALLLKVATSASKEVVRLQEVVRKHTNKLSNPIVRGYNDLEIEITEDKRYFKNKVTIRLMPIRFQLTVPQVGDVGEWSEDFKREFYYQVVEGIGHTAGQQIKKQLWPQEDQK